MPAAPPQKITSQLSDRDLLLHILSHVESMWAELEEFRPLLAMLKRPDGKPDMVGILGARRQAKKAARGGT